MMLAQGGLTVMGLVDTACIGRISTADMAGVALGNAVATVFVVLAVGMAMGLEPLVAQAHGAGRLERASRWRVQGAWATGLTAALAAVVCVGIGIALPSWTDSPFALETRAYLLGRGPGVFLAGLYSAERSALTAIGRSRPALYAVAVANGVNVVLDVGLLFGLGLGALGVGLATSASSWAMYLVARHFARAHFRTVPHLPVKAEVRRVLVLGGPVAAQLGAEVGVFSAASVLIAREGEVAIAAHQVALGFVSLWFMTCVGIGVAATARVGHHIGAGRGRDARQAGFLAMGLGAAAMLGGATVNWAFDVEIASAFAPGAPRVVALAATLLHIGAAFALSDGLQAIGAGALRGLGDTASTFTLNILGHVVVGAPVGLYLGWTLGWGAVGYWWGLTAGLTVTAVGLVARFAYLSARPVARLEQDLTDSSSEQKAAPIGDREK